MAHVSCKSAFIIFLVFTFTLLSKPVLAHIELSETDTNLEQFRMAYLVDRAGVLTIDEVIGLEFITSSNRLSLGTDAKVAWARIELKNTSTLDKQLFLHHPAAYHNKSVGFYTLLNSSVTNALEIDLHDGASHPHLIGGSAIFEFTVPAQSAIRVYVKTESYSHQWFSLNLYDNEHSRKALVGTHIDIALMVGILIALMLYNVLIFVITRKKENILYAFYLVSGIVWIALSYGLLANIFGVHGFSIMRLHLSLLTMPSFLILFMMSIFETKQKHPSEHRLLLVVLYCLVADFVFGIYNIALALKPASSLAALMIVVTMYVSIKLVKKGEALARYFLIGHSLFFFFNVLAVLYYKGLAPVTYMTSHGVGIGIMLEALMLAFIISYRMKQLEKYKLAQEELQLQAHTDPLTHLYNRRFIDQYVDKHLLDEWNTGKQYCVIMADLDRFKVINDSYGHQFGDEVLKLFAQILRDNVRKSDVVARFGGEEFLVLLPNCALEEACQIAEKVRILVCNQSINTSQGKCVSFSSSFGVATNELSEEGFERICLLADRALYTAKSNGRNQVVTIQNHSGLHALKEVVIS